MAQSRDPEVEMVKIVVPFALAILSMAIAMVVVLAVRPELRSELGRLRRSDRIELEAS